MLPIFLDLLAGVLTAIGLIVFLYAQISLVITAFLTGIGWGLAYLIIPVAALLYIALYWEEAKKPFFISVFGLLCFVVGLGLSFKTPDKAYVKTYETFFYNYKHLSPWERCLELGKDWYSITSELMTASKEFTFGNSEDIKKSFRIKKINLKDSFSMELKPKDLMSAVQSGNITYTRAYLEQGQSPNVKTDFGSSALMEAIAYGYSDIAKALIQHGADLNFKDANGDTPLSFAQKNMRPKMVELIEAYLSRPKKIEKTKDVTPNKSVLDYFCGLVPC